MKYPLNWKSRTIQNHWLVALFGGLVVAAAFPTHTRAQNPPFTGIIPGPIGLDTSPAILLVIDQDGSLRVKTDLTQPPFDGIEDTLFGVLNNSTKTILAIPIHSSQPIFAFDGDGFCGVDSFTGQPLYDNAPAGCPFGPTGYEGPGVSFAPNPDLTSGFIIFNNGLPPGGTAYFSLELAITTLCPPISGVPLMKQCAFCPLGNIANTNLYDGLTGPKGTIGYYGCAITSSAMLINYLSGTFGPGFITSPSEINTYLKSRKDGYFGSSVNWIAVSDYARSLGVSLYYNGTIWNRDDFTLDSYICSGMPVILSVLNNGHFVLATGQTTINKIDSYLINDPGNYSNDSTLQPFNYTYSGLRPFSTSGFSQSALYIAAHSPVELLVTGPSGQQTGLDPTSQSVLGNIPNSSYGAEALLDDIDIGSGVTAPEVKILEVLDATQGNYSVEVQGTGTGPYTLDFWAYDSNGHPTNQTFTGNATLGSLASFVVNYTPVPGSQLTVTALNKCPLSQGFWKNHVNSWPVASLTIGSQTYSEAELVAILQTPIVGDASLVLAHQLIATKLNLAHESNPAPIATTVANADGLLSGFAGKLPYYITPASAVGQTMVADGDKLDTYNNGLLTQDCQP